MYFEAFISQESGIPADVVRQKITACGGNCDINMRSDLLRISEDQGSAFKLKVANSLYQMTCNGLYEHKLHEIKNFIFHMRLEEFYNQLIDKEFIKIVTDSNNDETLSSAVAEKLALYNFNELNYSEQSSIFYAIYTCRTLADDAKEKLFHAMLPENNRCTGINQTHRELLIATTKKEKRELIELHQPKVEFLLDGIIKDGRSDHCIKDELKKLIEKLTNDTLDQIESYCHNNNTKTILIKYASKFVQAKLKEKIENVTKSYTEELHRLKTSQNDTIRIADKQKHDKLIEDDRQIIQDEQPEQQNSDLKHIQQCTELEKHIETLKLMSKYCDTSTQDHTEHSEDPPKLNLAGHYVETID